MTKILAIVCNRFRKDYTLEGHSVRIPTKPAVATPPPHTHTHLAVTTSFQVCGVKVQVDLCSPLLRWQIAYTEEELSTGREAL